MLFFFIFIVASLGLIIWAYIMIRIRKEERQRSIINRQANDITSSFKDTQIQPPSPDRTRPKPSKPVSNSRRIRTKIMKLYKYKIKNEEKDGVFQNHGSHNYQPPDGGQSIEDIEGYTEGESRPDTPRAQARSSPDTIDRLASPISQTSTEKSMNMV
ncbi:hypothetical protein TrST_g5088 [Triparma strigata]|uniref:Uncharacterized protein n=1 Tax=Triparma strigata TaxID=1606541 RepID=A0A9W7AZ77_9STRA|nr:hypothetical protein TrST_g5088 [Triparma strigata]